MLVYISVMRNVISYCFNVFTINPLFLPTTKKDSKTGLERVHKLVRTDDPSKISDKTKRDIPSSWRFDEKGENELWESIENVSLLPRNEQLIENNPFSEIDQATTRIRSTISNFEMQDQQYLLQLMDLVGEESFGDSLDQDSVMTDAKAQLLTMIQDHVEFSDRQANLLGSILTWLRQIRDQKQTFEEHQENIPELSLESIKDLLSHYNKQLEAASEQASIIHEDIVNSLQAKVNEAQQAIVTRDLQLQQSRQSAPAKSKRMSLTAGMNFDDELGRSQRRIVELQQQVVKLRQALADNSEIPEIEAFTDPDQQFPESNISVEKELEFEGKIKFLHDQLKSIKKECKEARDQLMKEKQNSIMLEAKLQTSEKMKRVMETSLQSTRDQLDSLKQNYEKKSKFNEPVRETAEIEMTQKEFALKNNLDQQISELKDQHRKELLHLKETIERRHQIQIEELTKLATGGDASAFMQSSAAMYAAEVELTRKQAEDNIRVITQEHTQKLNELTRHYERLLKLRGTEIEKIKRSVDEEVNNRLFHLKLDFNDQKNQEIIKSTQNSQEEMADIKANLQKTINELQAQLADVTRQRDTLRELVMDDDIEDEIAESSHDNFTQGDQIFEESLLQLKEKEIEQQMNEKYSLMLKAQKELMSDAIRWEIEEAKKSYAAQTQGMLNEFREKISERIQGILQNHPNLESSMIQLLLGVLTLLEENGSDSTLEKYQGPTIPFTDVDAKLDEMKSQLLELLRENEIWKSTFSKLPNLDEATEEEILAAMKSAINEAAKRSSDIEMQNMNLKKELKKYQLYFGNEKSIVLQLSDPNAIVSIEEVPLPKIEPQIIYKEAQPIIVTKQSTFSEDQDCYTTSLTQAHFVLFDDEPGVFPPKNPKPSLHLGIISCVSASPTPRPPEKQEEATQQSLDIQFDSISNQNPNTESKRSNAPVLNQQKKVVIYSTNSRALPPKPDDKTVKCTNCSKPLSKLNYETKLMYCRIIPCDKCGKYGLLPRSPSLDALELPKIEPEEIIIANNDEDIRKALKKANKKISLIQSELIIQKEIVKRDSAIITDYEEQIKNLTEQLNNPAVERTVERVIERTVIQRSQEQSTQKPPVRSVATLLDKGIQIEMNVERDPLDLSFSVGTSIANTTLFVELSKVKKSLIDKDTNKQFLEELIPLVIDERRRFDLLLTHHNSMIEKLKQIIKNQSENERKLQLTIDNRTRALAAAESALQNEMILTKKLDEELQKALITLQQKNEKEESNDEAKRIIQEKEEATEKQFNKLIEDVLQSRTENKESKDEITHLKMHIVEKDDAIAVLTNRELSNSSRVQRHIVKPITIFSSDESTNSGFSLEPILSITNNSIALSVPSTSTPTTPSPRISQPKSGKVFIPKTRSPKKQPLKPLQTQKVELPKEFEKLVPVSVDEESTTVVAYVTRFVKEEITQTPTNGTDASAFISDMPPNMMRISDAHVQTPTTTARKEPIILPPSTSLEENQRTIEKRFRYIENLLRERNEELKKESDKTFRAMQVTYKARAEVEKEKRRAVKSEKMHELTKKRLLNAMKLLSERDKKIESLQKLIYEFEACAYDIEKRRRKSMNESKENDVDVYHSEMTEHEMRSFQKWSTRKQQYVEQERKKVLSALEALQLIDGAPKPLSPVKVNSTKAPSMKKRDATPMSAPNISADQAIQAQSEGKVDKALKKGIQGTNV